jgi:hypothetical protein
MSDARDQNTIPPFTIEEAAQIRKLFMGDAGELDCPRCGNELTIGQPIAAPGRRTAAWQIRCDHCRRRLVLRNP